MSAATAILSRVMCRTVYLRDNPGGRTIGGALSLRSRAAAAVGVCCWWGYLSSNAGDKSHLPPRLFAVVHRGACVGVLVALSHR